MQIGGNFQRFSVPPTISLENQKKETTIDSICDSQFQILYFQVEFTISNSLIQQFHKQSSHFQSLIPQFLQFNLKLLQFNCEILYSANVLFR